LTITGEPGAWVCILIDTQLGSFSLPGLITFDLAYTPSFSVTDLGPLPPGGQLVLPLPTDCSGTALTQEPIYVQVAMFPAANPLPAVTSNVATLLVGNGDCDVCPAAATQDTTVSSLPGGMALFLSGLGGDFVFEGQAELAELKNGTAGLRGVIVSSASPAGRLILSAQLSGHLDQTDVTFPPANCPKKKLLPAVFVENGGPIDTTNRHYYTELTGDLVGLDNLTGALVALDDFGGAAQFDRGANGKNLGFGLCAGLETTVLAQPTGGAQLAGSQAAEMTPDVGSCPPATSDLCTGPSQPTSGTAFNVSTSADINLDFTGCPDPKSEPVVHFDFTEQAGVDVIDHAGDFDLVFDASDGQIDGVRLAQGPLCDTSVRRPSAVSNAGLVNQLDAEDVLTVQVCFRQDATQINDSRLVTFSASAP
jgi:hypothetical protein